jgi:hypothetical protein
VSTKDPGRERFQVRLVVEHLVPSFDPVNGWDYMVMEPRRKTYRCASRDQAYRLFKKLKGKR